MRTKTIALLVLALGLVCAPPAAAHGGGSHGGPRGERGTGDAPSSVTARVARAERALERAEERIDDGEDARAAAQLTAVRRSLARALRAAKRLTTDEDGPAAFAVLAGGQHDAVLGTVDLLDGQDGAVVDALAATLDAALDGRDDALATLAALDADAKGAYAGVVARIAQDAEDEVEAIDEALAGDTLTDAARNALTTARAQAQATATAAQAQADAAETADDDPDASEDDDDARFSRHHPGGPRR